MGFRVFAAVALTSLAFLSWAEAQEGPAPLTPPVASERATLEIDANELTDQSAPVSQSADTKPTPEEPPQSTPQVMQPSFPSTDGGIETVASDSSQIPSSIEDMSPEQSQNFNEGIWVFVVIIAGVWLVQALFRRAWLRWWYKGVTRP